MNAKPISLLASILVVGLLGCTITPEPEKAPVAVLKPLPNPAVYSYSYTIEPNRETPKRDLFARACRLSTTSCMELDSRPFEPCLVTTKTCQQKGAEAMQIAPLVYVDPYATKSR